jgi:hypothetical protein
MVSVYKKFIAYIARDWVSPLFLILFLLAWASNALKKTNFDLVQLQNMYLTIRGALLAEHAIDSKFNSMDGQMPIKGNTTNRGEA